MITEQHLTLLEQSINRVPLRIMALEQKRSIPTIALYIRDTALQLQRKYDRKDLPAHPYIGEIRDNKETWLELIDQERYLLRCGGTHDQNHIQTVRVEKEAR